MTPLTPRERRDGVINQMCAELGVTREEVMAAIKKRRVSDARNAIYAGLYERGDTLRRIGESFGRDHRSVHRGLKRHYQMLGKVWPKKRAPNAAVLQEHHDAVTRICRRYYLPVDDVIGTRRTKDPVVNEARRLCAFTLYNMGLRYRHIGWIMNRSDKAAKDMVVKYIMTEGRSDGRTAGL